LDDLHPSGSAFRIPTSKVSGSYLGLLAFALLSMASSDCMHLDIITSHKLTLQSWPSLQIGKSL